MHDGLCIASYSEYYTYTRHVDQTSLYCCGHSCSLLLYTCVCVACICELLDVCVFFFNFSFVSLSLFSSLKTRKFQYTSIACYTATTHTHTRVRSVRFVSIVLPVEIIVADFFFSFFFLSSIPNSQRAARWATVQCIVFYTARVFLALAFCFLFIYFEHKPKIQKRHFIIVQRKQK